MDKNDFGKLDPVMDGVIDKLNNLFVTSCVSGVLGQVKCAISCAQDDLNNAENMDSCIKNIHYACACLLKLSEFLEKRRGKEK